MSPTQAAMHLGAPADEQPMCFDPSVFELDVNPVIHRRYLPPQQATPEVVMQEFETSSEYLDTLHATTWQPSTPSSQNTQATSPPPILLSASSPASPSTTNDTDSSSPSSSTSSASTPRSDPPSPSSNTSHPHQCSQCSESYRLSGDLRKHWYRRHEKRFTCDVCSQRFNLKADLKRHTKSKHSEQMAKAEIKCDVRGCGASFTRRDNMMRHIREEHEHGGRKTSR